MNKAGNPPEAADECVRAAVDTAAQTLTRARTSFLANMSHEMRSPLAAIIGQCEQALRPGADSADWRAALAAVHRSAGHLLDLVNDVLDAAALEFGQLRLQSGEVPLLAVCEEAIDTLAPSARGKALEMSCDYEWPLPALIETDRLRLKQVLLNLLSNAIKFTDCGRVRLCLRASREEGLLIAVEDTGIGVAAERIEDLLQPFVQGESTHARRHGGSGLGLYISHQLLLRMGGSLEAARIPGGGSRFSVRLPLPEVVRWVHAQPLAATCGPAEPPLPALDGRVLLAEDDPILRQLLTDMLTDIGLRVFAAADGNEALCIAATQDFDLALLDMHMPVLDGQATARELRRRGCLRPILAVTADVLPESVAEHLAAGCQTVLAKPVGRQQLHTALGNWLPLTPTASMRADAQARLTAVRAHFLQRLRNDGEELRVEVAAGELDAARERLHRIKGAASMFGMDALRDACHEGELALATGERADDALQPFWRASGQLLQ
ncbi:MAG: response regulator [Xanthomonadales bacterium]|nr:response regulator [Xanthomonadales bacterium]MCE7929940.1 response regulator [Xanthomonadales bacterium PRO6]